MPGQSGGAQNVTNQSQQGNVYDVSSRDIYGAGDVAQSMRFATNPATLPGTIASQMGTYQNPYEDQVVGTVASDIGTQRDNALLAAGGRANAAGAFGGSRHGLVERGIYEDASKTLADTSGMLRRQGFMDSASLADRDIGNFQKGVNDLVGRGATVSNTLGEAGQRSFDIGTSLTGQNMSTGAQNQQQSQQLLDLVQAMFGSYTNAPNDVINSRLSAVSMNPLVSAGTTTGTQQSKLGPADYMLAGLSGIGNAVSLGWSF